jgi:hypothetical protein
MDLRPHEARQVDADKRREKWKTLVASLSHMNEGVFATMEP